MERESPQGAWLLHQVVSAPPDLSVTATSGFIALPVTSGLRVSAQLFQQCLGCS
jgi:hypothetical protein